MPTAGFEPTVSADERPRTYVLDRAATETGILREYFSQKELALKYIVFTVKG
jgi:hypothetical protein